jgi:PDZ domain-containing protein
MRRRQATMTVSGVLAIVLAFIGWSLPVPYVRLVPGPVTDTLGAPAGKSLITISGHATRTTDGRIYLVTVGEIGGPGKDLELGDVLQGWWKKSDAVVPTSVLYPPTETAQQATQQDAEDMSQSQDSAKVAALSYLGYKLTPGADVVGFTSAAPAAKVLKIGDVIVGIDGKPTTTVEAVSTDIGTHKPGDVVPMSVSRDGTMLTLQVPLEAKAGSDGKPKIGVTVSDSFAKPFKIDIGLSGVGGPSAGMAFALGIIDKVGNQDLTGGKIIAGTGTIDNNGNIGAIGGVAQKMEGARAAGATVFLVPKSNCGDALKAVPSGLRLVSVTTLSGAVQDLENLAAGKTASVPGCSAS